MTEKEVVAATQLSPLDLHKILGFTPVAASRRRGWVGLQAARYRAAPPFELNETALTHHMLALFLRPPEELEVRYEGVTRRVPPAAGSIMLVPAGSPVRARSSGHKDELHIFLEPGLVERVAAEAFDLDPARLTVPPADGVDLPQIRAAMEAVNTELTVGARGGRLAAESLANILAVQLVRHVLAPRRPERGKDNALSRTKLRAVAEYIEEHLDSGLTLKEMAAVAHLSAFHFARQFKAAIGMPPHQYVIERRVKRAQQLLRTDVDLSLAEIALRAGFSDQSQFSNRFKRVVGFTPRQFRRSARIA